MAHSAPVDRGARRKVFVTAGVVGACAVLLAVAAAFGGFAAVPKKSTAKKPNTPIDQGLFSVRVLDARAGRVDSGLAEGENKLVVRMRVTDLGKRTYGASTFLHGVTAELGGKRTEPGFDSRASIKGHTTSNLDPHMPIEVEAMWPLPDGAAPKRITVSLRTWEYVQSFTTNRYHWQVGKRSPILATVALPVRAGATS